MLHNPSRQKRCGQCKKHFCFCSCHFNHKLLNQRKPFHHTTTSYNFLRTLFQCHGQLSLNLTMMWFAILIICLPHVAQTFVFNDEITTTFTSLSEISNTTDITSNTTTIPTILTLTTPTITTDTKPLYYKKNSEQHRSTKNRRSASIEIVQQNVPHNFAHHPMYMNSYLTYSDCDRIFISKSLNASYGTKNGTFEGPNLPRYPPLQSLLPNESTTAAPVTSEPHARQCIYTFIAGEHERVRLTFTKFALRSEAPDCFDEYMDLYTEMPDPKIDLLNTPFGGRFCDQIIPHDRISLYQSIVIAYYTEKESTIGNQIFEGKYEFINATPYVAGTQMPNQVCSFAVYSDQRREGEFMSPTYPGVYPKNINCKYLFKGNPGQRVKLEFMDFDLYSGGAHCPMDYMKIYDGDSESAPLINTYCGQQRQLYVFSSGTSLFVHFSTMPRVAESTNRGFSAYFEFSEKFVNLGFIGNNETSEHILGSECDQRILSKKESNGTIYSPNYPFLYHSNIQCKYYIYGLQDAQNLERINFQFEMLQIPTKDVNECADAHVRLYTQTTAMDEFDYVFCGETIPPPVVSEGPILMVLFNSGTSQGQGFKAHYWFETDYKIPGTQASPGQCQFSFMSASGEKKGEFNSPRHPSNYPSSTFCTYEFYADPDERVMIYFTNFNYADTEVVSLGVTGYNERCNQDWMEIYAIGPLGREYFFGRFCSAQIPGPIITDKGVNQVKIVANTDDTEVSPGFLASYSFLKENKVSKIKNCGGNLTYMYGEKPGGSFSTPNYPEPYQDKIQQLCDWYITVAPGKKVSLFFNVFEVEGKQAGRGCANAVVRVWTDPLNSKPEELCGDKLEKDQKAYVSVGNVLRVMFVTLSKKSIGGPGFEAIWNEVTKPIGDESFDSGVGLGSDASSIPPAAGTESSGGGGGPGATPASSASTINGSGGGKVAVGRSNVPAGGSTAHQSRGRCPSVGAPPSSAHLEMVDSLAMELVEGERGGWGQHYETPKGARPLSLPTTASGQSSNAPAQKEEEDLIVMGRRAPETLQQQNQQLQARQMFHCAKNNFCISELLRCDGMQNCAFGDRSDEEGCSVQKDSGIDLGVLDLLGGIAGLTLFVSFTLGILCLTGIMVANWLRRESGNETASEKDPTSGANGGANGGLGGTSSSAGHLSKTGSGCGSVQSSYMATHISPHHPHYSSGHHSLNRATHHQASIHPSNSRTGSPRHAVGGSTSRHGSPYRVGGGGHHGYPSELTTPTHRVIETVMTLGSLGSSGSTAGKVTGMNKMWSTVPSTSSEGGLPPSQNQLILEEGDDQSFTHHHQQGQQYLHDSLDSPSNASIPPPPPPPTIGSSNSYMMISGGGRPTTSSLANFYAERPCGEGLAGHRYTTNTLADHQIHPNTSSAVTSGVQNIGSVTSIDRYGTYRTLGRNPLGGNSGGGGGTLSRTPALPTFGYGPAQSSFHTLPHHVSTTAFNQHHQQGTTSQLTYEVAAMRAVGNSLNQVQQQQQKLSPSADSLMMMVNVGSGNGEHNGRSHDDEDTSLSLRMAATTHLQQSTYGNGGGGGTSGNGNMILGEMLDEEQHSETMMLSGLNHGASSEMYKSNNKRTFITGGSYLLSDQSDSLLIDE